MSVKPDLDGVPETALWTLWFRAEAARGDRGLLDDPMAVEAVDRLDYPFAERFGTLTEEFVLTRTPRGFPADHPAARWLRHTSFTSSRALTDAEVCSPALPDLLAEDFAALVPMVRWLNGALGFRPAKSRM